MAPRNNDANADYKKKNFPVEDNEADDKDIVPCLLHKKHKVVKLVKSQLQKIQEEGLICNTAGSPDIVYYSGESRSGGSPIRIKRESERSGTSNGSQSARQSRAGEERSLSGEVDSNGSVCICIYLLTFLLTVFLLLFLMVWISAGPLSNKIAHTPISPTSFVRTDNLCTLEKKYLLRWSKPEYFE